MVSKLYISKFAGQKFKKLLIFSLVPVTIDMLKKQGFRYPPLRKQTFSYKFDVDLRQIPKDMLYVSRVTTSALISSLI